MQPLPSWSFWSGGGAKQCTNVPRGWMVDSFWGNHTEAAIWRVRGFTRRQRSACSIKKHPAAGGTIEDREGGHGQSWDCLMGGEAGPDHTSHCKCSVVPQSNVEDNICKGVHGVCSAAARLSAVFREDGMVIVPSEWRRHQSLKRIDLEEVQGRSRQRARKALDHFKGLVCGPCVILSRDAWEKLSLLGPG